MSVPSPPAHEIFALTAEVSFTRLPFGGAVLVNGTTLMLAECGEAHAVAFERLLTSGVPPSDDGPAARTLAEDMVKAGWLIALTR